MLERVLLVEDHHRHRRPVRAAAAPPALGELRGRRRARSGACRAARPSSPAPPSGSEVTAASTSPLRSRSAEYAWSSTCSRSATSGQAATSPSTSRNQVASESALTATGRSTVPVVAVRQRVAHLVVQQLGLPGQPEQHLPGRGRPARRRPLHHDLADLGLERPDPLADRRGRHVQVPGRGLERAVVGDRDQRGQLGGHEVHEAMLMVRQNLSLVFSTRRRPSVAGCSTPCVAGLLTGLSLIVAIGAQNAYVLRQGLAREHVGIVVADLRALRRRADRRGRRRHRPDRRAARRGCSTWCAGSASPS